MTHPFPPAVLAVSIALGFMLGKIFPIGTIPDAFSFLGWLIAGTGAVFFLGGYFGLISHRTPVEPKATPSFLVTSGFFKVTRNPFYLGYLLIAFGAAVYFGNLLSFAAPVLFFTVVNLIVIPYEEKKLRSIFSETYETYARNVRRWM